VPNPARLLVERLVPLALQLRRDGPAVRRAPQAHADQVALLVGSLAVAEALAPVEDAKVVDEVHISGLRLDLQLRGPRDGLDGIQRLELARRDGREVTRARMSLVSDQGRTAEVHDELRVVIEDDRSAVEPRTGSKLPCQLSLSLSLSHH